MERYRLVTFGLDGVIVNSSLFRSLLREKVLEKRMAQWMDEAMEEFQRFLDEEGYPFVDWALDTWWYSHLRGMSLTKAMEIAHRMPLMDGVENMFQRLKEMGYKIAIISDSFSLMAHLIKDRFQLDYAYANELLVKDSILTGEVNAPFRNPNPDHRCMQHFLCKPIVLEDLTKREGITDKEVVAIGDGYSDRCIFQKVGLRIGYKPYELVEMHRMSKGRFSLDNLMDEVIWDDSLDKIPELIRIKETKDIGNLASSQNHFPRS